VSDEVSTGELYRGLQEIKAALVPHGEYEEHRRHVGHRLDELDKEIEAERHAREAAFAELRAQQIAARQAAKGAMYACIGAIVAALFVAAITAWVAGKGGH
jgi:hypothetical protein